MLTPKNNTSIVEYMSESSIRSNIEKTLAERTPQFIASVASLVNSSADLRKCERKSVLSACLVSASINLPFTPGLGLSYIVPYDTTIKEKGADANGKAIVVPKKVKLAQWQIGWKGLVQLALRTKRYRHINVTDVREGEYLGVDRMTGQHNFSWVSSEAEREKKQVIGYLSYFELLEGFSKTHYMTVQEIENHAKRYSSAYRAGFGNWIKDFDPMGKKTVLKLLLDKFGPKSQELEKAIQADQAAVEEKGLHYVDNQEPDFEQMANEKERNRIVTLIKEAKTLNELKSCAEYITDDEVRDMYSARLEELSKGAK